MKIILAVALAALSITASSAAIASPASDKGGHYEWHPAPQPGPNKSNLPNVRRVWVADPIPAQGVNQAKTEGCCAEMPRCAQPPSQ